MSAELVRSRTPEELELRRKKTELNELETKLAQRELDLVTLQTELNTFQLHYLSVVGKLYAELDEIEAKVAETRARLCPEDDELKKQAGDARTRAGQSAESAAQVKKRKKEPRLSERLKKLYREVAKCFHPDLARDDEERTINQKLMAEAIQAYQAGDEEQLEDILNKGRHAPERISGDSVSAELVRIIRQIARIGQRLREIDREIINLRESSLAQFKQKAEEATRQGLDLLVEMAAYLKRQVFKAKVRLANLNWANLQPDTDETGKRADSGRGK